MHCTHGTEGHAGNLPGARGKCMVFLTTNFRKQLLGIDAQTRRYVFSAVKERSSVRSKYHNSFKQLLFFAWFYVQGGYAYYKAQLWTWQIIAIF